MFAYPIVWYCPNSQEEATMNRRFARWFAAAALLFTGFTSLPAAEPATTELLAVACKWNNCVAFYDAATGREAQKVEIGHRPHEMALSRDGAIAFVTLYGTDFYYDGAEGGRSIAILDMAKRVKLGEIDLGQYC